MTAELQETKEWPLQDHRDFTQYPDVPQLIRFYIAQQLVFVRLIFLRKGLGHRKSCLVVRVAM